MAEHHRAFWGLWIGGHIFRGIFQIMKLKFGGIWILPGVDWAHEIFSIWGFFRPQIKIRWGDVRFWVRLIGWIMETVWGGGACGESNHFWEWFKNCALYQVSEISGNHSWRLDECRIWLWFDAVYFFVLPVSENWAEELFPIKQVQASIVAIWHGDCWGKFFNAQTRWSRKLSDFPTTATFQKADFRTTSKIHEKGGRPQIQLPTTGPVKSAHIEPEKSIELKIPIILRAPDHRNEAIQHLPISKSGLEIDVRPLRNLFLGQGATEQIWWIVEKKWPRKIDLDVTPQNG